jgi:hypothetical protein
MAIGTLAAVALGVGALGSATIGAISASKAGKAQVRAADAGVAETRAARDALQQSLAPYSAVGIPALQAQMNLLGLGTGSTNWEAYAQSNPALMQAFEAQNTAPSGFDFGGFGQYGGMPGGQFGGTQSLAEFAQNYYQTTGQGAGDDISQFTLTPEQLQQQAVSGFEANPLFQSLARQGEEGILQNASATGGLRGGNVQGALAQFRPALLNQFIEQQYGRLGGMANLGQNSAAGVGAAGVNAASSISDLLGQAGAARAGSALGQGKAFSQPFNLLTTLGGMSAQKSMGF